MSAGRPHFDARTATWLGVGFYIVGSYLLFDAFDRRGRSKPWAFKLLPGT
jgi:hypothetical protein